MHVDAHKDKRLRTTERQCTDISQHGRQLVATALIITFQCAHRMHNVEQVSQKGPMGDTQSTKAGYGRGAERREGEEEQKAKCWFELLVENGIVPLTLGCMFRALRSRCTWRCKRAGKAGHRSGCFWRYCHWFLSLGAACNRPSGEKENLMLTTPCQLLNATHKADPQPRCYGHR